VLLQLRAAWTHGGGTWALPGGALDSHEDSVSAAAREAEEEAGISATDITVKDIFSDDHGPWRYDTVIAHTTSDAGAHAANAESEDLRWVLIEARTSPPSTCHIDRLKGAGLLISPTAYSLGSDI
jgi:8-oxo-dGTP pyrophosphatase MutT (NUDIX family)